MPRGDRTGPLGQGAMSGRRAGYCSGNNTPGYMNPVRGGGDSGRLGRIRGGFGAGAGGWGWRNMYNATGLPGWMRFGYAAGVNDYPLMPQQPSPEMEKRLLEEHAAALRRELDAIDRRLNQISTKLAGE